LTLIVHFGLAPDRETYVSGQGSGLRNSDKHGMLFMQKHKQRKKINKL